MVLRRVLVTLMAVGWMTLGFLSDNVPHIDESVWVFLCSIVAGSALALVRWRSHFALNVYTAGAATVGTLRSVVYIADSGSWGPAIVWALFMLTTVVAWSYINSDDRLVR